MNVLQRGGNAPLSSKDITIKVKADQHLDVSAFRLYDTAKTKQDDDFIFYGQKSSQDNSVILVTEGAVTQFDVSLAKLPVTVEKIAIAVTVDNATIASLKQLEIVIEENGQVAISCPVTLVSRNESSLILGELYKRNDQWKFRFIDQGFTGGLQPLAEHYGVEIESPSAQNSAPQNVNTPPKAEKNSVNLSKITLTKDKPTVNLSKSVNLSKEEGFGKIRINLNWNQNPSQQNKGGGISGFLNRLSNKGIDLDLGAYIKFKNGEKSLIQALGNAFGDYDRFPFVQLESDDRTGAQTQGEWMNVNGAQWDRIDEVIIYTFIYEGVANWGQTDGVVTLHIPHQPPVETHLTEGDNRKKMCAIARLKNVNDMIQVERLNTYFDGHKSIDQAYQWGFRWKSGSK